MQEKNRIRKTYIPEISNCLEFIKTLKKEKKLRDVFPGPPLMTFEFVPTGQFQDV